MTKAHILLTGCHGLLGQRFVQKLTKDHFILGVDIHENTYIHGENYQYKSLDITNRKNVKRICEEFKPDWIVNTAAFTDVDACEKEKERCWKVNVESVENLVFYARINGAKLIHFSSDYVFDGTKELYSEDDAASPLNYYGRAKLASENIVKGSGIDWAILRTSTLYDIDALKGNQNFVTWVVKNLQQGESIKIVTDQWGNPTLARNLAAAAWKVILLNRTGVYQTAGKEIINRYDFAKKIATLFDLNEWLLEPIVTMELGQSAIRPLKMGLDISKAERKLELDMLGVDAGLSIFKSEYLNIHRNN
ncbi:SDR family oxidoreductase [candidate division KSB1 bacterium]|nr:SDR family oxidoreductase [candidate division KSB1 bacterium]